MEFSTSPQLIDFRDSRINPRQHPRSVQLPGLFHVLEMRHQPFPNKLLGSVQLHAKVQNVRIGELDSWVRAGKIVQVEHRVSSLIASTRKYNISSGFASHSNSVSFLHRLICLNENDYLARLSRIFHSEFVPHPWHRHIGKAISLWQSSTGRRLLSR